MVFNVYMYIIHITYIHIWASRLNYTYTAHIMHTIRSSYGLYILFFHKSMENIKTN